MGGVTEEPSQKAGHSEERQISEGLGWGNFDRPQGEPTGLKKREREEGEEEEEEEEREREEKKEREEEEILHMCLVCNILQLK